MGLKAIRFLALLTTALALVPTMAHLMELPNKIGLSREDYLTVQQLYRGWAFSGIVVVSALLSNVALAIMVRREAKPFVLTLVALLCIAGTQAIFWTVTYPANRETANWTTLPANWLRLRDSWEYSHAAAAVLNLGALIALILSVIVENGRRVEGAGGGRP